MNMVSQRILGLSLSYYFHVGRVVQYTALSVINIKCTAFLICILSRIYVIPNVRIKFLDDVHALPTSEDGHNSVMILVCL